MTGPADTSLTPKPTAPGPKPASRSAAWLGAGIATLEYVVLAISCDLRDVLAHAPSLVPGFVVGNLRVLALLLIGGLLLFAPRERTDRPRSNLYRLLSAHAACYLAFAALSIWLASHPPGSAEYPRAEMGAWLATGALAGGLLLHAAFGLRALVVSACVGSCAIAAGYLTREAWLWAPLASPTTEAAAWLLRGFGSDVVSGPVPVKGPLDGLTPLYLLGKGEFRVHIAAVCSGFQGMGLTAVLVSAYLWLDRRRFRFPRALWLLPAGLAVSWFANVLRLVALTLIGAYHSPDLALGGFHSRSGWLLLTAVSLGVIGVARWLRWFQRDSRAPLGSDNPVAPFLVPFLVVLGLRMSTGLFREAGRLNAWYGVPIAGGAIALWTYRRELRAGLQGSLSWFAPLAGLVVAVAWILLAPGVNPHSPELVLGLSTMAPWAVGAWVVIRLAGAGVVVPLVEELAFRGYLYRRVIAADFSAVPFGTRHMMALVVSSVAFGALHQRWVAGTLAGVVFAIVQWRRGRLSDAVVAHGVCNLLILGYGAAFGQWTDYF